MATRYNKPLYDQDFHAWTADQASKLRRLHSERSNLDLDLVHLAEEIESVGVSDRREVLRRMTTIIEHLLKLQFSPASEPRGGWERTVRTQRRDLGRLFSQSPSLVGFGQKNFAQCYHDGAEDAVHSHDDLRNSAMPRLAPFTFEDLRDMDWLPERQDV